MKKILLTTGLVGLIAASSFGQGQIGFKTTAASKVYSATDNAADSLTLIPTTGTVGSFGTVTYEVWSAPVGTAAPTVGQIGGVPVLVFGAAWTGSIVPGPIPYFAAGTITPAVTITLPANSGAAGGSVELEVVAFTGTSNAPTLYGYSGQTFATITTVGNAALEFTSSTGNPAGSPPTSPVALTSGTSFLGSIILVPAIPEPSTIALGGLAAAALLAFRRRK